MAHRYLLTNLKISLFPNALSLKRAVAAAARIEADGIVELAILRRSVDARKKPKLFHVLSVEFTTQSPLAPPPEGIQELIRSSLDVEEPGFFAAKDRAAASDPVVVVGAGPAGLFAALALARAGVPTTLLERGKEVDKRLKDIGRLRAQGVLDPESNICFGEGGAGAYTDGKLYTRIKHPYARWVLKTFVDFGADPGILVDSHPHLGTENLVAIVKRMRARLLELGAEIRFETRAEGLTLTGGRADGVRLAGGGRLAASAVILAVGHSARDTFEALSSDGVRMEAKPFAVGLRAEHPQELINEAQYGRGADARRLGAAAYQLTHQVPDPYLKERGVYSFCMCPGGFIVPSPTEAARMAINGMSNSNRSTPYANSGVVVQVTPEDLLRHGLPRSPLIGLAFQRELESAAYAAVRRPFSAPAMLLSDFVSGKAGGSLAPTNFRPLAEPADLTALLPPWLAEPLREGLKAFGGKLRGYVTSQANLLAVESRTSSPLRLLRGEDGQSVGMPGLYPAGEGAGYAGGIVSAAVDGLRAAEEILKERAR